MKETEQVYGEATDPSNKRIVEEVKKLCDMMEQEGRGFIFAPITQENDNHQSMFAMSFVNGSKDEAVVENNVYEFWATLWMLVRDFQLQVPEDLLEAYRRGAEGFVALMGKHCFLQWEVGGREENT